MESNLLQQIIAKFTHTRLDRPPIKLRNYPHLVGGDILLWNNFLTNYPNFFSAVSYDVRVGEGIDPTGDMPESIRQMGIELTKKRIDVLGQHNNEIWIVELKWNPLVEVLGQLESYKILFLKGYGQIIPIKLCAIINWLNPDLEYIFKTKRIEYFIQ